MAGGMIPVAGIPADRKKEALDRLIAGRLLAQEARSKGLDNTDEFRSRSKQNEPNVLITALFRKEIASKLKITKDDINEQAKKARASDKNLSEDNANLLARRTVSEAKLRKIEEDLIAAARKEIPGTVDKAVMDKIGKEKVADDAVLATVGTEKITFGAIKGFLNQMSGGMHGSQDLWSNPVAVARALDREMTGKTLVAYAKKQGVEKTEWMTTASKDMERSVLIDLLAERDILMGIKVTDKEIDEAFVKHAKMFARDGKKAPRPEEKAQIRAFLEGEKRKKAIEVYIEGVKKKAKVTVKDELLPKV
jgi:hypothetical protein